MARNSILLLVAWTLACGGRVSDSANGSGSNARGGARSFGGAAQGATYPGVVTQGAAAQGGAANTTPVQLVPFTPDDMRLALMTACQGSVAEENAVTQSMWLIDASASMSWAAPGSNSTKWALTRSTVLDALSYHLDGSGCYSGAVSMLVHPGQDTDSSVTTLARPVETCINVGGVVGPLFSHPASAPDLSTMTSQLDAVVPTGGTAILDAYSYAAMGFDQPSPMVSSVVLVTDGRPTIDVGCRNVDARSSMDQGIDAPVEPIIEAIANEYANGIRTFVVGTPGSELSRSWLSRAAIAGGTAQPGCDPTGAAPYCHVDLTVQPDAMRSVADSIAASAGIVASCSFSIPPPIDGAVIDPTLTFPIISTMDGHYWRVPYDPGPAESCSEGFRVVGTNEIGLCPTACDLLHAGCGRVAVLFFCEPTDNWVVD